MKKIITLCLALMTAVTFVSAKDYQHSIGMVAGLGIGAQYKTMVMPNFTILAEIGYCTNPDGGTGFGYAGVPIANGVFAYQTNPLAEGDGIKMSIYAGGQMKLGYVLGDAGVFGFGAAAGIEANMKNAPIAFSFDFRPGYAFLFTGGWAGGHMFDYSFNLGVRYTL
ncbi:MAG: hypothetical protein IKX20_12470 [Paludibacteraceae bacterium]|nr:hypothetical protein [Paludibacteraceae bacterium]